MLKRLVMITLKTGTDLMLTSKNTLLYIIVTSLTQFLLCGASIDLRYIVIFILVRVLLGVKFLTLQIIMKTGKFLDS